MFGLTFAIIAFNLVAAVNAAQPEYPLRDAVECRTRAGLPNVLGRLKAGKEVRIAYLGGSITAQAGWRPKSLAWFQSRYPSAKVSEIDASIGGTGSDLGVYRLHHDVLAFKPQLLFVEFAVNDSGSPPERIRRAMEGIVRQTWRADSQTDICFVYTLTEGMLGDLQSGKFPRAASVMEEVADRYGIPSIHMGLEVARLQKQGKLVFSAPLPASGTAAGDQIIFSPDGVHPYPETGHKLYLDAIVRSMPAISASSKPLRHRLPPPLDPGNWERARMDSISSADRSDGWKRLDPTESRIAKQFESRLPELWKANRPGETLRFRFTGTSAYIYDLLGPDCGQVGVKLDDKPEVIQPRFDAFSNYHRLGTLTVAEGLPAGLHTVVIRILPEQPDKLRILHRRIENQGIKQLDPATYNDTAWYVRAILVNGEVVPWAFLDTKPGSP